VSDWGPSNKALGSHQSSADAQAFEETKYPDFKSQWYRAGTGTFRFDPSKAWGRGQEDANLADQAAGEQKHF
jgi:hypothetical protein